MRKRNTKDDFKVQTLAFEIITLLNECTGILSRVSTRNKHNRRGIQKKKQNKKKNNKKKKNKVRQKSRECHDYKPQPFPDTKRKRNRQNQTSTK